jgi:hypothetical protein
MRPFKSAAFPSVLIEHLAAPCRCPPGDHAITLGEDVLWEHFGSNSDPEGTDKGLNKCSG